MKAEEAVPAAPSPDPDRAPADSERDQISQNIDAVLDFYTRDEQKISMALASVPEIALVATLRRIPAMDMPIAE